MPYRVQLPRGTRETPFSGGSLYYKEPVPAVPVTPVAALRKALRAWYAMTVRQADGDLPTLEGARALLSEIRRLWDDVSPAFAEAVERQEARVFSRETGRCPYCGEIAVFHDPDRGGAAT